MVTERYAGAGGSLTLARGSFGVALAGAVCLLTLSAKMQVPMFPVPMTLQTAVVLVLACLMGWRGFGAALGAYVALGAAGAPVFASGGGLAYLLGPTGGYLLGFAAAGAALARVYGARARWGWGGLLLLMLGGHAVILALGWLWLTYGLPAMGAQAAMASGVIPFFAGSLAKSLLAVCCLKAIHR